MATPEHIVLLLREASDAYYNGAPLKMDDDTYDGLVSRLTELDRDNPYLSEIGSPPKEGAVQLPFPMPSLDKIKPGESQLTRFMTRPGAFVLSEKLDGLSALWIPSQGKLLLRGNGLIGQDISHIVRLGPQGLVTSCPPEYVVRGELIMPRSEGRLLARNIVNGLVHRSAPPVEEVQKIHFVAYELLQPSMVSRSRQFALLREAGYEVAWNVTASTVTEAMLSTNLQVRRLHSPYDTDGIVLGMDTVASPPVKGKNPKDCVAFKMPLAEQSAETVVQEVIWSPSAQGYLIPRIRFQPVVIGSATIEYCTGHNARNIVAESVGPGAKIRIRRSGDVIPKLDAVLVPAASPSLPPEGSWAWEETSVHIKSVEGGDPITTAKLHHFLKTVSIPGAGPATAQALVAGNVRDMKAVYECTAVKLSELLGPKTGASLYANIRTILPNTDEITLMIASSLMSRGVGETKLAALFALEPNPTKWTTAMKPTGWTADSLTHFIPCIQAYITWRQANLAWVPFPSHPKGSAVPVVATAPAADAKSICITGFRDAAFEDAVRAKGHQVVAAISGKTNILVVSDTTKSQSEKMKEAVKRGITVMTRSAFAQQFL